MSVRLGTAQERFNRQSAYNSARRRIRESLTRRNGGQEVIESFNQYRSIVRVRQPWVGQDLSLERGVDADTTLGGHSGREVDGHSELLGPVIEKYVDH